MIKIEDGWSSTQSSKPEEVTFADKLERLKAQTYLARGNIRTNGDVNYIMPNRAVRRRAAKAARSKK